MTVLGLVLVAAYLLGSIPFSYLVARRFGVRDVREVGSGNVGATNVMRAAGKTAGVLAFALDFLKGVGAAALAARLLEGAAGPAAAAAVAVVGHMYPVWIGFRGGKGVATGAGAFLPLAPIAVGVALLAFPLALAVTRYVSVASLVGTATLSAAAFAFGYPPAVAWAAVAVGALVFWKHRGNLRRIAEGRENRLGRPKAAP